MGRIFDLDLQLLNDALILAINIFILFFAASYLMFNPVRDMLKKRQDKIAADIASATQNKEEAFALKSDYETKLKEADKEVEAILSEARKKALKREEEIVAEAKEEAARIIKRAQTEIDLEKKRAMDDMKKEMIQIASMMAGKIVTQSMNIEIQDALVEETLKEMGESTWQN